MNYRCTTRRCRKRQQLSKPIEQYVKAPRCRVRGCGGRLVHDPEPKHRHKRETCYCGAHYPGGTGEPLPHRRGSLVWCKYHSTGPTEEDYRQLYL